MQTQCPHCDTQFRITEEQYQIADGLVRCGVCNETFNAFEVNKDDAQLPVDQQAPPDDSLHAPFESTSSSSTTEEPLISFESENSANSDANNGASHTVGHEFKLDVIDETTAKPNSPQAEKNETEFDLFQTEDDEPLAPDLNHSIVPEECMTENSHAVLTGVLWSAAILFLSFTLVAEYIWFNRHQLIQVPQAKPWVEHFCQLTNCEMAALRDPAQIELVTRNIYSHPNQKDTLIVAVTLINHANFAQPYPLMQIDFSDVRGSIVAARRFDAQTYLQTPKEQLRLLAPEATSSFTMVIQDPGDQAMTYEFNFL